MQWDLIAAGVEEGVIDFFKLEGKEATKMKGRSKSTFSKKTKRWLKGMEEDVNADLVTRANWLRTAAGHHIGLANKLINVARSMKTKTSDAQKASEKQTVNARTIEVYKELAVSFSKKAELTKDQKEQIREGWTKKR